MRLVHEDFCEELDASGVEQKRSARLDIRASWPGAASRWC